MTTLDLQNIRVAFYMGATAHEVIVEQLEWALASCRDRVACDINRTLVGDYLPWFSRVLESVSSANFWFFEGERDAMLFRLTWNPSQFKPYHWISIREDGRSLVIGSRASEHEILVDTKVAHVKCPA